MSRDDDRCRATTGDGAGSERANEGEGLPKAQRLRKRREFLAVQNRGRKHHCKHLLVFSRVMEQGVDGDGARDRGDAEAAAAATTQPSTARGIARRVGFTVSTKVGNAVVRNRVKRRLREAWRRHQGVMPAGFDYVLVAKRQAASASYQELVRELRDVARRVGKR